MSDVERIQRFTQALSDTVQREGAAAAKAGVSGEEIFTDMVSALAATAAFWLVFNLRRARAYRLVPNIARQITALIGEAKEPPQ